MPKFTFRLEAQDGSGHHRVGGIFADSKEEAAALLEDREQAYSLYALDTDELVALETDESEGTLARGERAKLALHRQELPYVLVSLEEAKAA